MNLECHTDFALSGATRAELAAYRYEVFVGRLGWELPCPVGHDQDQFDIPEALHLAARSDEGHVIGYARLLPTTGRYLLAELFPQLLGDQPVPQDAAIWELSRYAAMNTRGPTDAHADLLVGKQVLLQAVHTASLHGAERLVFCTSVAIERLAMRWGVDIRRMGPPVRHGQQLLVAALIEFNDKTLAALGASPETAIPSAPLATLRAAAAASVHAN